MSAQRKLQLRKHLRTPTFSSMKRLRSADDEEEVLVLWLMRRRALPYREQILVPDFRLDVLAMDDNEAKDQFRFTVGELALLIHYLGLPKVIYTHEGVRSNAIEALAICLRRLLYPKRWIDMAGMFGRAPSTLCHIFYYVVEFLDEKLTDLLYFDKTRITNNMERYRAAIASKAPESIQGVWGFIDGTIRPICRPSKGQQAMFNGHKRVHALKFQTVVTPDGLISHLFGPVDGRRHDLFMLKESKLKAVLENNAVFHNKLIYGDPAYGCTNVFCCPYIGCRIDAPRKELNKTMSTVRVSVEWSYGQVTKHFSFLDYKRHQRVATTPTATPYKLGVFYQLPDSCPRWKHHLEILSLQTSNVRREFRFLPEANFKLKVSFHYVTKIK